MVQKLIEEEERIAYRFVEYLGDVHILGLPHPYFAVVADSGTAVGVTQFLANEMGYLAEVVIITDNPPEEHRAEIAQELTESIESILKPDVILRRTRIESGRSSGTGAFWCFWRAPWRSILPQSLALPSI